MAFARQDRGRSYAGQDRADGLGRLAVREASAHRRHGDLHALVDALQDFYHKWYRPDLMAVVAAGDFDVDKVETLIRERFSKLPKADAQAAPRPAFDVPARKGTSALVVKDPENPDTVVSIYQSRRAREVETVGNTGPLLTTWSA
jgi:hypothetical protein